MTGAGVLLDAAGLRRVVARLAVEVSAAHPDGVVLVGVLSGSFCLVADLARAVSVPCQVDFLALSAFSGASVRVRVLKDLDLDVSARHVVLVEDIVDTGLSARYVTGMLASRGAASVEVCTLFDRPSRRIVPLPLRYVGLEAPDAFLVGYGLDYAGRYRNLPSVHEVALDPLECDAGAYDGLFGAAYRTPAPQG